MGRDEEPEEDLGEETDGPSAADSSTADGSLPLTPKLGIWTRFCQEQEIAQTCVPLLDTESDGRIVRTFAFGKDGRLVLRRSDAMDEMVVREAEKIEQDHRTGAGRYEGLIYMMLWLTDDLVLPLYVGKAEKIGLGEGNLSANVASIRANRGKFARWGYNYAYHVGDLSAVVCPGHAPEKRTDKYRRWAERLFLPGYPTPFLVLRRPLFFWVTAWSPDPTCQLPIR